MVETYNKSKVYLSGESECQLIADQSSAVQKDLQLFDEQEIDNTVVFSEDSSSTIMDTIINILESFDITRVPHDKKWKLTYNRQFQVDSRQQYKCIRPEFCKVQV